MEMLVEILLELLLECSIECITDSKTPLWLRVTAIVLLTLLGAAYVVLFLIWTIGLCYDGKIVAAAIVGVIGIGLPVLVIWELRALSKQKRSGRK